MATNINNKLVCNEPHANLDSYYGPYDSVHDAYLALADTTVNGVNYTKKYIGLTVGVWNSVHTEVTEYWFKGGLQESNLVEKTSGGGGLPSGVKIVTFDKNGGSGVQNSIITDTASQVVLPECTLTKSGETFSEWSYNGTQKNPGDTITIGSATVVQAVWSSSKPSHVITWFAETGVSNITGKVNGVAISSGDSVKEGSTIVLTATMNSGYNFSQWSGLPSGTSTSNPVSFVMGTSDISVTAIGRAVAQKYTVSWTNGSNVTITGKVGGTTITSGSQVNAGSTVVLTATPDTGYQFESWTGKPSGATESGANLTFSVNSNISGISATATAVVTEYTLEFKSEGEGITKLSGKVEGNRAHSGSKYTEGSNVEFLAELESEYTPIWEGCPAYAVINYNKVTFTLKEDVSIILTATKENGFSYCGLTYEGDKKGGDDINNGNVEGNGDDKNMKWFEDPSQLTPVSGSSVTIPDNKYNYIYAITKSSNAPTITIPDDSEKTYSFVALNKCGDDTIPQHFIERGWMEVGTNKTAGDLDEVGNYIFIFIDAEKELTDNKIVISIV